MDCLWATDSDTVLLALEHFGNITGLSLRDVVTDAKDEERSIQPRMLFCLAHDICPSSINCFALDSANKRIFTGDRNERTVFHATAAIMHCAYQVAWMATGCVGTSRDFLQVKR